MLPAQATRWTKEIAGCWVKLHVYLYTSDLSKSLPSARSYTYPRGKLPQPASPPGKTRRAEKSCKTTTPYVHIYIDEPQAGTRTRLYTQISWDLVAARASIGSLRAAHTCLSSARARLAKHTYLYSTSRRSLERSIEAGKSVAGAVLSNFGRRRKRKSKRERGSMGVLDLWVSFRGRRGQKGRSLAEREEVKWKSK